MNPKPVLASTRGELRLALDAAGGRAESRPRVALVPTMGALHRGHAALMARARQEIGPDAALVASVFVNPLQFAPGEDLDRYPRTLAADLERCRREGADLVFTPAPDVVYPDGPPLVRVSAGPVGDVLEGASRPGHFDGVLTVVCKLLHLVRPDVALFGQKDAQQLAAIRRMVRDLDPEDVARGVINAVKKGKRSVWLPKTAALAPAVVELPRRVVGLITAGIRHPTPRG